jgi:mannosyltransferase OCH1-like enzyme
MIPKKIHYCWLSEEHFPANIKMCIKSWKEVMPDYEVILWNRNRFDTDSVLFVEEACRVRKWAFAADYIRSYALYTEGGIYLDSDVLVKKKFDEYLGYDFFTSVLYHHKYFEEGNTLDLLNEDGTSKVPFTRKPGIGIQAAVLGSIKGHPYLKDCMEYYKDKNFILSEGKYFSVNIAPDVYAMVAEKYGFRYKNELQLLKGNMLILPSEIFAGNFEEATINSYSIHLCTGSWTEATESSTFKKLIKRILIKLGLHNFVRRLIGKPQKNKS